MRIFFGIVLVLQKRIQKSFLYKPAITFFLLPITFSLFSVSLSAQDSIPKRPKIGLVLSGGGAKGLAHIGVLKVIEEAGIKIDYVGGTSMGAIIGGLYASGYNAQQLDSIFNNTDYDAVIQDFIPRSSKNFYEKGNDERYALTLPFNKFKLGIPSALSKGLYNYNMITRLTHSVRHIRDFNQLPIPFLCIATNIETGEEVLLNKGFLAQAILASGAFPSLYSPVIIEGKYLIDGGVVNNYPAEEIKKLGADIIIGVDVQDDLKDRAFLKDATRILVQISNLQMIKKMQEKIELTDIYIKPNVGEYSVISFDKGVEIIEKGEVATNSIKKQLLPLGTNYKKPPLNEVKTEKDSFVIKSINPNKLDNYTHSYIVGKLRFKPGNKITYGKLKQGIENLNASQSFGSINYSLDKEQNGDRLNLNLTENSNKTLLRFGLHYDGLYKSALLINLTQKKVLFKNDVVSGDLVLGDNFRYYLDYYIDNGFHWSFGFKSRLNQFNRNITTDFSEGVLFTDNNISTLNIDFIDFTNQAYMQTLFVQKFLVGAGFEFKRLKIESVTLQNSTSLFENSDYSSLFGYMKFDSLDNKYFPKSGWSFNGDLQYFLYSTNYTNSFSRFSIFKADFSLAQKLFKKTTLKVQSEAGLTIGEESIPFFNFVLGGYGFYTVNNFRPFYGYDFLSLAGNSYLKALFQVDVELFKRNHLNVFANFSNIGDNIFETNKWIERPAFSGYGFGYGMETVIGPLEIKHSWSPETKDHFTWFGIGFWF
jgi:NTE family protein